MSDRIVITKIMMYGIVDHVNIYRAAAMHSPQDKVVAVMGMDLTLGYFYKMLAENIPMCEHPTVRY